MMLLLLIMVADDRDARSSAASNCGRLGWLGSLARSLRVPLCVCPLSSALSRYVCMRGVCICMVYLYEYVTALYVWDIIYLLLVSSSNCGVLWSTVEFIQLSFWNPAQGLSECHVSGLFFVAIQYVQGFSFGYGRKSGVMKLYTSINMAETRHTWMKKRYI